MTSGLHHPQLPLPVRLRDSSVFASFLPGPNAATFATLRALEPAGRPVSIWLHGPPGAGKTHLLQALCARAGERGEAAMYLPLKAAQAEGSLAGCGELPWVCLDDVEAVLGRDDWDAALFRLYTELEASAGRLVLAARQPPKASGVRLADLASRLAGGIILPVVPLREEAARIQALQARASLRGLELPEDVAQYLLRRLPRDLPSLLAFLDTLDMASLAARRRLTVPFVGEILAAYLGSGSAGTDGEPAGHARDATAE